MRSFHGSAAKRAGQRRPASRKNAAHAGRSAGPRAAAAPMLRFDSYTASAAPLSMRSSMIFETDALAVCARREASTSRVICSTGAGDRKKAALQEEGEQAANSIRKAPRSVEPGSHGRRRRLYGHGVLLGGSLEGSSANRGRFGLWSRFCQSTPSRELWSLWLRFAKFYSLGKYSVGKNRSLW